jgi:hypothetical protein
MERDDGADAYWAIDTGDGLDAQGGMEFDVGPGAD